MKQTTNPIVVEQLVAASVNEVWNAITNLEEMKQWYFEVLTAFEPRVGFETQFKIHHEGRDFTHIWKITEVIPNKKIAYTWRFEEYPGEGLVSFELFEQGENTLIRLTDESLENFPNDVPEFTEESCRGGWEYFIQGNLKNYFDKKS